MQITVAIGNRQWQIELEPGVPPVVRVDGEDVSADLQPAGKPGLYSLLVGTDSYELAISRQSDDQLAVTVNGRPAMVRVEDPLSAALRAASDQPTTTLGALTMQAPMPGRVVAVRVSTGQEVQAGDPLVVLEAMKMESSITAPHDGSVRQVAVRPGQTVARDEVLVILDCGEVAEAPAAETA